MISRLKFAALVMWMPLMCVLGSPGTLNPAPVADSGMKRIAFTFDDGPRPFYTEALIDELSGQNVHATFFVVGKQAKMYPDLVRDLVSHGHEIANHSWDHPSVRTLNEASLKAELDKTRLFLKDLTGQDTSLFRAPGGTVDYLRNKIVVPGNYEMVMWTVHSLDHEKPPAGIIRQRVLAGAHDGAVVIFHTGIQSTLEALPGIIQALRSQGYTFVTVSEMLGKVPATLAFAHPASS